MPEAPIDLRTLLDAENRLSARVHCFACGQSLAGTPADGACPACAAPAYASISREIAARLGWLDADGRLSTGRACESCKYNLRTLRIGDRCPECGELVAPYFARLGLALADPRWLRACRRGGTLLLTGLTLPWFVLPITFAGASALANAASSPWDILVGILATIMILATLALPFVAMLIITRPEPTADGGYVPNSAAQTTRVAAAGTLALGVLGALIAMTSPSLTTVASLALLGWGLISFTFTSFLWFVGSLRFRVAGAASRARWRTAGGFLLLGCWGGPLLAIPTYGLALFPLVFLIYIVMLVATGSCQDSFEESSCEIRPATSRAAGPMKDAP